MSATSSKPAMNLAEWSMVILLSLLWGGAFFSVGVAVKELPTMTIVVCRVGFAAITLWAVVLASGLQLPTSARLWRMFFIMGFLNNAVPFSLIVWGQGHISSGLASILNATTPLFTVVVAHYLTSDERMTPAKWAGVVLGIAGVAVLIGGDVFEALGTSVLAQLAILGAALSYAFAAVYGRSFRRMEVPPLTTAAGQVTASTFLLLPLTLFIDMPWRLPVPSVPVMLAILALAVLGTALAYILYFRILATAGATNLSVVTFLIPVSAVILGVLFLNETLKVNHGAGMALIALGLACIDGRLLPGTRKRA